jgi:hypothetical protein
LIQAEIASQPDALYKLTQTVIVQELGLQQAQERIQQLEAELARTQSGAQAKPTSFLGGLFSGGSKPAPPAGSPAPVAQPPVAQPVAGPAPAAPRSGMGGVGSFLTGAAAGAAGVVGGQLIFDGLRRTFGNSAPAPTPSGPAPGAGWSPSGRGSDRTPPAADQSGAGGDWSPSPADNASADWHSGQKDTGGGDWGSTDTSENTGGGDWKSASQEEDTGGSDWQASQEESGGDWSRDDDQQEDDDQQDDDAQEDDAQEDDTDDSGSGF